MKTLIYTLLAVCLIVSCSPKGENKEVSADSNPSDNSKTDLVEGFILDGDSILLPSFEIQIELSKKAAKKISKDNETIIVQAYLSGTPKDSVTSDLIDEMGEVNLGSPHVELTQPGTAKFRGVRVSKAAYSLLKDKDFQVLINVFSGRKSSELNLIECDILQEPVTVVKATKHVLKGKLIGE